jgi:hypothetical protein
LESGDSPLTRQGGGHIACVRNRAAIKTQAEEKYYVRRHSPLPF